MTALERRRDYLCNGLEVAGYQVTRPRGAFYVLVRSPFPEDAFSDWLSTRDVFVMPGSLCGIPNYVRLSLTASDRMVEWALPRFGEAIASGQKNALGYLRNGGSHNPQIQAEVTPH
jgi:aspartate aminotransferase